MSYHETSGKNFNSEDKNNKSTKEDQEDKASRVIFRMDMGAQSPQTEGAPSDRVLVASSAGF